MTDKHKKHKKHKHKESMHCFKKIFAQEIDPEIIKVVADNFWELITKQKDKK